MHVHASVIDGLTFAAMLIIVGFVFRMIALRFPDSAIGKALAVVF